jgi:hypothetical protein
MPQAGMIVPYVFFREVAEGRGCDKKPQRIKSFGKAWKSACRAAWVSWPHPARPTRDGGPEPHSGRSPGAGGHEDDRAQDRIRVSAQQHRERRGPARRRSTARCSPRLNAALPIWSRYMDAMMAATWASIQ